MLVYQRVSEYPGIDGTRDSAHMMADLANFRRWQKALLRTPPFPFQDCQSFFAIPCKYRGFLKLGTTKWSMFKSFFHYKPSNLGYPHLWYPHGGFLVPTCEDKNMERGEVLRFACGLEGMIPISMFLFVLFWKFKIHDCQPGHIKGFSLSQLLRFRKAVIIMDEVDGMGLSLRSRSSAERSAKSKPHISTHVQFHILILYNN